MLLRLNPHRRRGSGAVLPPPLLAPCASLLLSLISPHPPLQPVEAAHDNYPAKSINVASAPSVEYYETFDLGGLFGYFADPHAVHGSATADGGYVLCGKATEGEGSGQTANAFVVKVREDIYIICIVARADGAWKRPPILPA